MSELIGVPTTCQVPDCPDRPRYAIAWWDLATGERHHAVTCARHLHYPGILAPAEAPVPLREQGEVVVA